MSKRDKNINLDDTMSFTAPESGIPTAMNNATKNLTPEYLDAMINNPEEHPEIRAQAKRTKDAYFGGEEEESIVEEPIESAIEEVIEEQPIEEVKVVRKKKSKKKKSRTPKKIKDTLSPSIKDVGIDFNKIKTNMVNGKDFSKFINAVTGELYTQKISLLSDDTVELGLKSMTVGEYKFLAKSLELFFASYPDITPSAEKNLTYALDTILSRCIIGDFDIYDLSIYDWIYVLIYLRGVSRGNTCRFNMSVKDDPKKTEQVDIDLYDLLDHLEENKSNFVKVPIHIEDLDNMQLVMFTLTRGDVKFAEEYCFANKDASLPLINLAMSIKGIISDDKMNVLSPEQRIDFFSHLNYDVMQSLSSAYSMSDAAFKQTINNYFDEYYTGYEALKVSDFILSFYDI
jgi:hypothetical protein